jgi:hypothetical protein
LISVWVERAKSSHVVDWCSEYDRLSTGVIAHLTLLPHRTRAVSRTQTDWGTVVLKIAPSRPEDSRGTALRLVYATYAPVQAD